MIANSRSAYFFAPISIFIILFFSFIFIPTSPMKPFAYVIIMGTCPFLWLIYYLGTKIGVRSLCKIINKNLNENDYHMQQLFIPQQLFVCGAARLKPTKTSTGWNYPYSQKLLRKVSKQCIRLYESIPKARLGGLSNDVTDLLSFPESTVLSITVVPSMKLFLSSLDLNSQIQTVSLPW